MNAKQETTPYGKTALKIGISSAIAAMIVAVGSLGYYGFGLSSQTSSLDRLKSGTWSASVKHKIQATYAYLFFSFYICIISAIYVFSDHVLFKMFSSTPMAVVDFWVQTVMQNGRTLARFDSRGIISIQRIVWVAYCAFLGAIASPVFRVGIMTIRISIHLTCILVSLLVILSFTAPVGKFAAWRPGLSICEVAVFVTSVGAALFPITSTAGAIFFSLSFYGGLILYPLCFLCHSQQTQIQASELRGNNYCPVAASVPMLFDVISIFGRMAVLIPPS